MIAVVFTSTRTSDDDEGYAAAAARMQELARLQDGFLGIDSVRDPDTRRGITVSYWRDEESARAWRQVAEHLEVQRIGHQRWYTEHCVTVAEVIRTERAF